LSPFLLFELRHNFANTRSIFSFIFGDTLQKTYSSNMSYWGIVSDAFFRIFARLVFYFPSPDLASLFDKQILHIFAWTAMLITFAAIYFIFRMKNKYVLVLISLWLFLSLALLGLYKKSIYDYLFTFIFPLPFLIIGNFLSNLISFGKSKKKIVLTVVGVLIFISIFLYNLKGIPFQFVPNRQKDQARIISEAVIKMSDNKPYNFALISKGNSDHAYRYYLDVLGHSPIQIENPALDPQKKTITNQLLVVCEDPNCQPLGNSLFDVATFGRASIAAEQDVIVVKIFKLVHYEEGKTK